MIILIPARGGSKGLPNKNIKPLLGKPLIQYTIEAALSSKNVSRVLISTDDDQIAEVARKAGAEVPFMRPPHLAQDDSLAIETYIYTIKRLRSEKAEIDELTVLLPTAPLRQASDIDTAIELFRNKKADSVISCYPAPHPLSWHRVLDQEGRLLQAPQAGEKLLNRQSEEVTYLPNGAIYVFQSSLLLEKRTYYSQNTFGYVMPAWKSVDIDTQEDFDYAEFLMKRHGHG